LIVEQEVQVLKFADDLENLIVLLSILRARLQPGISYVRAESVSWRVRYALIEAQYVDVPCVKATATIIEALGIVENELVEIITHAPPESRTETGQYPSRA